MIEFLFGYFFCQRRVQVACEWDYSPAYCLCFDNLRIREPQSCAFQLVQHGVVPVSQFSQIVSIFNSANFFPFSLILQVCSSPPLLFISCTNYPGRVHDTTTNILATKEFSVNIISEPFIHGANYASLEAPEEFSEWVPSGLTMAPNVSHLQFFSRSGKKLI